MFNVTSVPLVCFLFILIPFNFFCISFLFLYFLIYCHSIVELNLIFFPTSFCCPQLLTMLTNAAYKPGRVLKELQELEDQSWECQEETLKAK